MFDKLVEGLFDVAFRISHIIFVTVIVVATLRYMEVLK